MMELPTGWAHEKFETLLEFALGGDWGKAPDEKLDDSTLVRCIRASELRNWDSERGKSAALRRIKNVSLEKRRLKSGDILVEISGGGPDQAVGRTVLITPAVLNTHRSHDFVCTNFFRLCRPASSLNAAFLNWYLTFFYRSGGTKDLQGGSNNLRNLRFPDFVTQELPLPPVNEQRRIVGKIEALFDQIDKAVESLQTARTTLGLYRQSLLKSAFEGRLTANWRAQNADKLEAPETLLTRIQRERDTRYKAALNAWQDALDQWRAGGEKGKKPEKPKRPINFPDKLQNHRIELPELPHGWVWAQLGLCSTGPAYGTAAKSADSGEVPVIRMGNLQRGRIDWDNLAFTSDADEIKQYSLRAGDVLFNRTNSPELVGKTSIYKGERPALFAGYLVRVNQIEKIASGGYLTYFLNSPIASEHGKTVKTDGVNQSNINASKLQEYPFPYCSPAEQDEIVNILDAQFEAADALEAEIDAALSRANALRQSILKKAFSGQLVPQDPNDEPVSALLERIKADRAKAPKAKKRKTSHA